MEAILEIDFLGKASYTHRNFHIFDKKKACKIRPGSRYTLISFQNGLMVQLLAYRPVHRVSGKNERIGCLSVCLSV